MDFEKDAMARASLIERQLQGNLQRLKTLAGLWASRVDQTDPILSENEFLSFIEHGLHLQKDTLGIYVIGNVPAGRENEYVSLLNSTNGAAWNEFKILSPQELSTTWLLENRSDNRILPLTYVWSQSADGSTSRLNNSLPKGLDLSELKHLSGFIYKVDQISGDDRPVVSVFFPDVMMDSKFEEPQFFNRFAAILRIPQNETNGNLVASYVRMDFSTAGLIERAIGSAQIADMALAITNENDLEDRQFMPFVSGQQPQFGSIKENARTIEAPVGLSFIHTIEFPYSKWTLIFTPKPGYYETPLVAASHIAAIGLTITLLLVSTTNLMLKRREETLELVKRRTAELTVANVELQKKHTELAAVNDDLKHKTEEAQRASAAKSEFLATMSHEIRTPMNGVLGMASLLGKSELDEEQKDKLSIITSSGKALLDLLNDILDLSKIESGRLELENQSFDLAVLLKEVEQAWKSIFAAKGVALVFRKEAWLSDHIVADVTRLRQILNNLISNALKFTEAGEVKVMLSQSGTLSTQIMTHIRVQDTGIGINAEALPHIFDQFTQADASTTRKYGGTGLGLAICKNLLEHMGGLIGVDSQPGQGTTIWFNFPSCPAVQRDVSGHNNDAKKERPSQKPSAAGLRILIAEDNPVNQQLMKALLSTLPCQFDMVHNGDEALKMISSEDYDVVLMDIQMPVMDGLEATKHIRELQNENAEIPIIAMTANALAGDKEKYLAAGMTDYVSKPLDPNLLIDKTVKHGTHFRHRRTGLITPQANANDKA